MRHVIVGDGVAGHTAAATIREEQPDADIHVFTTEQYPFYDRIGLRDYVRRGRDVDDLILEEAQWYADRDIALHLDTAVTGIDRDARQVETAAGEMVGYDRLLLATGGAPRTLPMEQGVDRVHHLWELDAHGRPLRRDLATARRGVVIGGGLLGFDLVGAFSRTDTATTYLIREQHWWPSVLDPAGAAVVHRAMRRHGVAVHVREEATAFRQDGDTVHVDTTRARYHVGVVGMAIGHDRNTALAPHAGLETGDGIRCDATLQTGDPRIYAAGDVAAYWDPVLEQRNLGGSWVTAQEQGAVAGRNMAGADEPVAFVDTYTVNHFGLNVASLGDPRSTPDRTTVTAFDPATDRYRKLVLAETAEGQRIVGAAIIGAMQWMYPLKQCIRHKTDVSDSRDALEDVDADISGLPET